MRLPLAAVGIAISPPTVSKPINAKDLKSDTTVSVLKEQNGTLAAQANFVEPFSFFFLAFASLIAIR